MTTNPGITPRQALDKAMLNIAEAMPVLTEKELHVIRIKAGFQYPILQEAIIEWLLEYFDQHHLERDYTNDAPWLYQMRHQIYMASLHIMGDEVEALGLSTKVVSHFTQFKEALLESYHQQEEVRKHKRLG
ncbi:MAG: hypothetical protein RBJ76_13080 [Stenomitos frigidus ULC029]